MKLLTFAVSLEKQELFLDWIHGLQLNKELDVINQTKKFVFFEIDVAAVNSVIGQSRFLDFVNTNCI